MKKSCILLIFTFISIVSFAQVQRTVRTPANRLNDSTVSKPGGFNQSSGNLGRRKMMQELNLSADQKKRLQETRQSVNNKKEAIENDDKLSAEQKEERRRELKRSQAREMQTILNADQREKMKTIRQEMFNKRKMDRIQQNN